MLFLLSIAIIQWIAFTQVVRTTGRMRGGEISRVEGSLTSLLMLAAAVLLSAPLLMELASILAYSSGIGISTAGDYLVLWLLGSGSGVALAVFGFRLYKQRHQKNASFLAVGANSFGVLIGLYIAFVVVDQLAFFAPPSKDVGMINWGLFQEMGNIKDVQCASEMLVVKDTETEVVTYRCPRQAVVVLGRFTGTPIVPWPSYTEGTSRQLAVAMQKMNAEAIKLGTGDN